MNIGQFLNRAMVERFKFYFFSFLSLGIFRNLFFSYPVTSLWLTLDPKFGKFIASTTRVRVSGKTRSYPVTHRNRTIKEKIVNGSGLLCCIVGTK